MRVVTQQQLSISHGDFYHPEPSLALKDKKLQLWLCLGINYTTDGQVFPVLKCTHAGAHRLGKA
jgi:hypothetical protein